MQTTDLYTKAKIKKKRVAVEKRTLDKENKKKMKMLKLCSKNGIALKFKRTF